jgi:hypothetical protein
MHKAALNPAGHASWQLCLSTWPMLTLPVHDAAMHCNTESSCSYIIVGAAPLLAASQVPGLVLGKQADQADFKLCSNVAVLVAAQHAKSGRQPSGARPGWRGRFISCGRSFVLHACITKAVVVTCARKPSSGCCAQAKHQTTNAMLGKQRIELRSETSRQAAVGHCEQSACPACPTHRICNI